MTHLVACDDADSVKKTAMKIPKHVLTESSPLELIIESGDTVEVNLPLHSRYISSQGLDLLLPKQGQLNSNNDGLIFSYRATVPGYSLLEFSMKSSDNKLDFRPLSFLVNVR